MILVSSNDCGATLQLSREELDTIRNCLNETCNGIELFEFQTRVGVDKEYVRTILAALTKIISPD